MNTPTGINTKMIEVIELFHLARDTKQEHYEDQAMEILETIQSEIGPHSSPDYKSGLAGIGSGILYLINEGFVEADPEEVFAEFDLFLLNYIYFTDLKDLSFNTGFVGVASYFLNRIKTSTASDDSLSILKLKTILISILDVLSAIYEMNGYTHPMPDKITPSDSDRKDIKSFVEEFITLNICNTQANRLLEKIHAKTNLRDVTFLLPIRFDSTERFANLSTVLDYIDQHTHTQFIILEAGPIQYGQELEIKENINYIYQQDNDPIFHRTRYNNDLIRMARTPIVAIWDADVLTPINQINDAVEQIRNKQAILSYPYDGIFYELSSKTSAVLRNTKEITPLLNSNENYSPMFGKLSVGGAFFVDREQYIDAGMENENFYGWGPEDTERLKRITLLGLPVYRVRGELYHLWHPRGINSGFGNIERNRAGKQELVKICRYNRTELLQEIASWHWIETKSKIEISFIVPIYNVEKELVQCIDSLLGQSLNQFEIILIDDGSTDSSGKIADQYAAKDSHIKVLHQANKGLSAARNSGLNIARGEYIVFVDSDDWLKPNSIDLMYNEAITHQADLVMGNLIYCYPDGTEGSPFNKVPATIKHTPISGKQCFIDLMENRSYPPMVCNYIYKRSFIEAHSLRFENVVHEDELWTPIAFCLAERAVVTDINFYNYRQREGSIMHTQARKKRILALLFIANKLIHFASRYKFTGNKMALKSQLYVKIFELYALAFRLLPQIKESSFILPRHHLYCFTKIRAHLTSEARRICQNYYLQSRTNLKKHLLWRVSPWAIIQEENISDKTLILVYNTMWEDPLPISPEEIPSNCIITTDRKYLSQADAVVFHLPSLATEMETDLDKPDNQCWIGWCLECEENHVFLKNADFMDLFDLKMSYHQQDDIIFPYFGYSYLETLKKEVSIEKSINKTCMVVSSPVNKSSRIEFLKELMQYTEIDSYGKLFNNKQFDTDRGNHTKMELYSSYKFVIAFENAIAADYVTEKFFDPLLAGTVPIYLGAPNIDAYAPGDNCFVDARKFESPRHLAEFINECCANEQLYASFFDWKKKKLRSSFVEKATYQQVKPFVRLCEKVNEWKQKRS